MFLLVGCELGVRPPAPQPTPEAVVTKPAPREGALVTYLDGAKIGRVTFHDDGEKIASDIAFAGKAFETVITRSPRHVRLETTGKGDEKDVPADTAVLENGDWQAYAIAAEWFESATEARAIHVLLPLSGANVDGTIRVRQKKEGGKLVDLAIKDTLVHVEIDADGIVRLASVPSQRIEVRREGDPAPGREVRVAPSSVDESAFDVTSNNVALSGTLWMPKGEKAKPPVALIVAGSGPTDREGNSVLGLRSDCYRMLAEALATRGIASVRFDKRGVGTSGKNFDPAKLVLEDFVADAGAFLEKLKKDGRFSSVAVVGHSEGGMIGILLAERTTFDALALVATPGRPLAAVLHDQLSKNLDPKLVAVADKTLVSIRLGMIGEPPPPELAKVFPPTVRAFLRSELDVDPSLHFKKTKVKAAIVQGEHDLQITVPDAQLLAESRPDAKLTLVATMNHALKDEPSAKQPQLSYVDPSMPLAPGLVDAVAAAIGH
jgi:pimeloyl-ACP methyl ester carboxylesterase